MDVKLKKPWRNRLPGELIDASDEQALELIRHGMAEPTREAREFAIVEPERTAEKPRKPEGREWD